MTPAAHPQPEEMQRFLLGDLPEDDIERLARHVEECPACQEALPAAAPADAVVALLRGPLVLEPHSGEPECAETIETLVHRLGPGISTRDRGDVALSTAAPVGEPEVLDTPTGADAGPQPAVPDDYFGPLPCPFGRYQILERLGKGGMGAVYLALDTTLERKVALKVGRLRRADARQAGERFLREARAAAGLQHEGICRVLDYGVQGGIHFLTMEYIQGRPLTSLVEAGQPLEPARAAGLVHRVALALAAAHRQGVVHRDLKPANIMLDERDQPRVVDFGLARREQDAALTRPGTLLGTPAYMSPEQVEGTPTDARTDIYGLGVILYELLTGRRPFSGVAVSQLMYQIVHGDLQPPSAHRPGLDATLEAACLKAMSRSPQDRFATMDELGAALQAFLASSSAATQSYVPTGEAKARVAPRPLWPRIKAAVSRNRWAAALTVLAIIGLGTLGYFAFVAQRAPAEREPGGKAESSPAGIHGQKPTLQSAFKGWIDVRVWEEGNPDRRGLRLNQADALPLRAKDKIRLEAKLNRPAYLYVFWIDAEGRAQPVYPWKPGHWETRPEKEEPVSALDLPPDPGDGWEMEKGTAGMETLVMLVRETPLSQTQEKELHSLLAGLSEQSMQNAGAAVWFENGEVVHDEADRGPNLFNAKKIDDPVVQTQRLLRKKLAPLCDYCRAVSFANRGK
jgi:predicted Ser/Thr protein kinase